MFKADEKTDQCVDHLCGQGCTRVTGFIAGLKDGRKFPEIDGLSLQERLQVLEALESVMAVYDGVCER